MWNAETAQFLHNWYATPEGTYAITQENRLFQHLISQWPRRGHTLLDIGCGAGIFLEMLWHYGFDVTGLDTGTDLLDMKNSITQLCSPCWNTWTTRKTYCTKPSEFPIAASSSVL